MKKVQFQQGIRTLLVLLGVGSIVFFRAQLGEGYNIAYFSLIAGLIGALVGSSLRFKA